MPSRWTTYNEAKKAHRTHARSIPSNKLSEKAVRKSTLMWLLGRFDSVVVNKAILFFPETRLLGYTIIPGTACTLWDADSQKFVHGLTVRASSTRLNGRFVLCAVGDTFVSCPLNMIFYGHPVLPWQHWLNVLVFIFLLWLLLCISFLDFVRST